MRRTLIDLTGMTFGFLYVVSKAKTQGSHVMWNVRCVCGVEKQIRSEALRSGKAKSCGCGRNTFKKTKLQKKFDLVNQRFGRLLVLWRGKKGNRRSRSMMWDCKCDCGKITTVSGNNLRKGRTKSCGCLQLDAMCLELGRGGLNVLLQSYKRKAEQRGLPWELSEEEFKTLVLADCHYCGEPPRQILAQHSTSGRFIYNNIDLRNKLLGYVLGNAISCCGIHNRMKGDMRYDEFIKACSEVAAYVSVSARNF